MNEAAGNWLEFSRSPTLLSMKRWVSILGLEVEMMVRLDVAHRARLRAHHHAVGARATRVKAHTGEIVTGRNPCRGEHHVVAGQFFERKAPLQIQNPAAQAGLGLLLVARGEA